MADLQPDLVAAIRERYARVLDRVTTSARRSNSVRIVVVTKMHPLEVIQAAVAAGVRLLGENYAEEAVEKIKLLGARIATDASMAPGPAVEWHMVGHVQSRKAKLVAQFFSLVHSLDSLSLAQKLDRAAREAGHELPVLLEFNVSGEAGKHGWAASDDSRWQDLVPQVEAIAALPNLRVRGLMTMPPLSTNPENARKHFRNLRRLRDFLAARVGAAEWAELSMGTSDDYQVAIEEGATLVRIGQAILGPRPIMEPE